MEEHRTDQTVGLRSRIKELRRRLVTLESNSSDHAIVALDRRVARLSERLTQETWSSSADMLSELGVDLLPESLPSAPSLGSSADFFSRVDALLGEVGPLRQGLAELAKSTVMISRPLDRVRLNRAIHLADLADRMIREARSFRQSSDCPLAGMGCHGTANQRDLRFDFSPGGMAPKTGLAGCQTPRVLCTGAGG